MPKNSKDLNNTTRKSNRGDNKTLVTGTVSRAGDRCRYTCIPSSVLQKSCVVVDLIRYRNQLTVSNKMVIWNYKTLFNFQCQRKFAVKKIRDHALFQKFKPNYVKSDTEFRRPPKGRLTAILWIVFASSCSLLLHLDVCCP
jgi:hypothetical protein